MIEKIKSDESLKDPGAKQGVEAGSGGVLHEGILRRPRRFKRATNKNTRLKWLVNDFDGISDSVYEAIMVAARRARQVGRRQKREVDAWNANVELAEITPEEDDRMDNGVDHFKHPKPTVQALFELTRSRFDYHYPDEEAGGKKQG